MEGGGRNKKIYVLNDYDDNSEMEVVTDDVCKKTCYVEVWWNCDGKLNWN